MKHLVLFSALLLIVTSCSSDSESDRVRNFLLKRSKITCDDGRCYGEYRGSEYAYGEDVAHQFSNLMCERVGKKLKTLYKSGKYNRVNMKQIGMSTRSMGSGKVVYKLSIPFSPQSDKCNATTAFDHVGGWGHKPELKKRLTELEGELLFDDFLDVSELYKTSEGLKEYWIQWRHKEVQKSCEY